MKSTFISNPDFEIGWRAHRDYWEEKHYDISVDRVIEEMSELCKILLKERRGQIERNGHLVSDLIKGEIADVMLCLEYLCRSRDIDLDEIVRLTADKSKRITKKLGGKRAKDSKK